MVRLFQYEGYKVSIAPEALMLQPFKKIWSRDKSKDKHKAMQELGYVYFMEDPRSDYQYLVDREMRSQEIIKGEGFPEGWHPDNHERPETSSQEQGYGRDPARQAVQAHA